MLSSGDSGGTCQTADLCKAPDKPFGHGTHHRKQEDRSLSHKEGCLTLFRKGTSIYPDLPVRFLTPKNGGPGGYSQSLPRIFKSSIFQNHFCQVGEQIQLSTVITPVPERGTVARIW